MFFGTNDNDTASYASTLLGQATILSASQGVSQASDAWLKQNHQQGQSESGYWLLDPAEIQRLPVTRVLIKFRNLAFPVMTRRLDYRRRLRWLGRWDRWRAGGPTPVPDLIAPQLIPPSVQPSEALHGSRRSPAASLHNNGSLNPSA